MDKATILGVFNFVSFHLCKTLLNRGIEVYGVSIGNMEQISFHEEKRLEIGRNANFIETSLEKLTSEAGISDSKQTLILPVYDFYMLNHDRTLLNDYVIGTLQEYINKNKAELDIMVVLPMQFMNYEKKSPVHRLIRQVKQKSVPVQAVYLPTIYGPWQPSVFLFQQAIMSTMQKGKLSGAEREWQGDALFVDDAIETMIELMETGNPGEYLLESGQDNYWRMCADYLNIGQNHIEQAGKPQQTNRHIVRTPVKKVTALADSFSQQIGHTRLFYQNQS